MNRPGDFALAFALTLSLASSLASWPAPAQVAPTQPQDPPNQRSSPWNSTTIPAPLRPPTADGSLSLRVYGALNGQGRPGGTPRRDNADYAVDVSAVMTRCADGNLLITALVIGGQLTPLDNRCPSGTGRNPPASPPSCDARRWNCKTGETQPAN